MKIVAGFADTHRAHVSALYWQAFGPKLGIVLGPHDKGLSFIDRVLDPTHGISAVDPDGKLLGVAGFKTVNSALVGGTFADMRAVFGFWGATWRAVLISVLERDTENKRFLMDGIFVAPEARGKGVGTALLNAIYAEAKSRGYAEVRLDVIDTNPRARALYEREGFVALKTEHLGPLRHFFGFKSATTMVRALS